jgi:hypothetical protein
MILVSCPINNFTEALEFGENGIGGGGPGERALVSVVMGDVTIDLADELADGAERTTPDGLVGDEREPALDLIEPARVGGGVMEAETRMAGEPGLDPRMLVRRVVVGDQMQVEGGRSSMVEMVEKGQELLMPMTRFALRNDRAIEHVESRKQRRGAVPIAVVGDAFEVAEPHAQYRLGALQCLDSRLFIDTQHHCVVRRIETEAHHVAHLFDEKRCRGKLETLGAVG